METSSGAGALPEGIFSLLDTDLYKLTMQSAVLKYFSRTEVTYSFTNRTPDMKLSRAAFRWLQVQISRLGHLRVTPEELAYLKKSCPYLNDQYLRFLEDFRLRPAEHIKTTFTPDHDTGSENDIGQVETHVSGLWIDTILYEIPLLALTSEAYFKFCDRDWTHDGQVEKAYEKGVRLLESGCLVSEFGSRRRRDYHTQELVIQGLKRAQEKGTTDKLAGKITGTSNVHFAMRFDIPPIGTVAHEWFMGVAAVTQNYTSATEAALQYWIGTFGKGVLGIALTDTFGTPSFLEAFAKPAVLLTRAGAGAAVTLPSTSSGPGQDSADHLSTTAPPIVRGDTGAELERPEATSETYADVFTGVRQDSGDPLVFVKLMREFYDKQGTKGKKTIVFSDSLNVERCVQYREAAEKAGFAPSFGVGTFFTNDFVHASDGQKSVPLNIVIKLSSADGKPAVKISDNLGKNTGDSAAVEEVKQQLGYVEREWRDGDERTRWN